MKLSIIIPVYNEENFIKKILEKVVRVNLPKKVLENEIIIVDDGSEDDSISEINKARKEFKLNNLQLFKHRTNKGKGAAIRTGIKKAQGDVILIQDADLEYNPDDYSRLLKPILTNKVQVVYGSRLKNYPLKIFGRNHIPLVSHYLGNKFLTLVTNFLYKSSLTDMETCYKVFRREVLKGINLKSNRFDFEPEVTAKILKQRIKIDEIPIKVKPRGYSEGKKISWKDGFIALWTLIKYKFVD